MKIAMRCVVLLSVLVISVGMASCKIEEPVSPGERMAMFYEDIEGGNWDSIKQHIHPDVDEYGAVGAGSFWSNEFLDSAPTYTFGSKTLVGNVAGATHHAVIYTFTLSLDGVAYKISQINRSSEDLLNP